MKILVTGASGFVGKALCERLLSEHNTVVAPLRQPQAVSQHEHLEAIGIDGINEVEDWLPVLQGVEKVVHLAARVHVMQDKAADPLQAFRDTNVSATMKLAQQAAEAGVRRFVYISSIKVNGEETAGERVYRASDEPAPQDPYAVSKYEAEQRLLALAESSGMEVVIIRPPLVYGPGVKANFLKMMQWLNRGVPLPLGMISNARSLVGLDNLVDFIMTCLNHPAAAGQVFLVSDGEDMSTTVLLKRMAKALGVSPRLLPVPVFMLKAAAAITGKSAISRRLCGSLRINIDKNRELLGWTPPYGVDDQLDKAADGFQAGQQV